MQTANLSIDVTAPRNGASILKLKGAMTGYAEEILMAAYNQACLAEPRLIILDFSEVEHMNSTGVGLLVTLLIRADRQKQRLAAIGLTSHYLKIFKLTRLIDAIRPYADEAEALAAA